MRYSCKANFMIVTANNDWVLIKDVGPWDEYQTITNAAEDVVASLELQLGGRLLYYIDSEGNTDQLLHEDGRFTGFKTGGPPAHNPDW